MKTILALGRYILMLGAITAAPVFGQFTQISTPDASYTSSTTLVPITLANGTTDVSSITSGSQTITLSTAIGVVAQVGVSGWSTWSSPPDSETATPKVLARYSTLSSLTLTLSTPATTFGFELEPNTFGVFPITVAFMNGATTLGTVTQNVNGNAGARLFAATTTTPITSVVITASGGGNGFAIGQFRYSTAPTVPVPALGPAGICILGMLLLAAGALLARRHSVAI